MTISQDTFNKGRRIRKLLFQEQRALGDFELNELQDIILSFMEDLQDLAGYFGPVGEGFHVETTGNDNELRVKAGVYVLRDKIVFLDEDTLITGLTTPGSSRTDIVGAIITEVEKDSTEFPDILNPDSGDPQATRLVYDITFAVSEDHPNNQPNIPDDAGFIALAQLNRTASATIAPGEIVDIRNHEPGTFHEFLESGSGKVTENSALLVDVESATGQVASTPFTVGATTGLALTDNATNYIYIDDGLSRVATAFRPFEIVALEARVVTAGGAISSIEDLRVFRSDDQTSTILRTVESQSQATTDEVVAARGSQPSLDGRLDVSLNEDGTLKPAAAFGGAIDRFEIDYLRPHEQDPPDMTVFVEAGQFSYGSEAVDFPGGSSPTFTAPPSDSRIDLLFVDELGNLTIDQGIFAATPVAPSHEDKLVIAEVTLVTGQAEITDSDIRDVRPLVNLGGSGGGDTSSASRLQLALNDSVFGRALVDPMSDETDISGSSTGNFIESENFELDVGETLISDFSTAPDGAPTSIEQVGVVVLTKQDLESGDLVVRVDRGAGFESVTTFDVYDGTHVFTGGAGNVLNVEITNTGSGTINIEGYGMFFENIGGPTGLLQSKSGLITDSSGLTVWNTDPAAYETAAANFAFTWDAANDRLSWGAAAGGVADDLQFEFNDPTLTHVHFLRVADSPLNGVVSGSYVFFDVDRSLTDITLQVSAGPPQMDEDRYLLGKRIADPNGGNDVFVLYNNHIIPDSTDTPGAAAGVQAPPRALSWGIAEGLFAAPSPSVANPFITLSDTSPFLEGSGDVQDALDNASAPSAGNPFVTQNAAGAFVSGVIYPTDVAFGTAVAIPAGTKAIDIRSFADSTAGITSQGFHTIDVAAGRIRGFQPGLTPISTTSIVNTIIAGDGSGDSVRITAYSGAGGSITISQVGTQTAGQEVALLNFYK